MGWHKLYINIDEWTKNTINSQRTLMCTVHNSHSDIETASIMFSVFFMTEKVFGLARQQRQWWLQTPYEQKVTLTRHRNSTTPPLPSTAKTTKNIPIGIKVCTIYFEPLIWLKLFWIADADVRLSERSVTKIKSKQFTEFTQ